MAAEGGKEATVMYEPNPIDTRHVRLPDRLLDLVERLAAHTHDVWAQKRMREGWTYGPSRDDNAKTHPDLVPYDQLPESEKEYDRSTAISAIKAVVALGYRIEEAYPG